MAILCYSDNIDVSFRLLFFKVNSQVSQDYFDCARGNTATPVTLPGRPGRRWRLSTYSRWRHGPLRARVAFSVGEFWDQQDGDPKWYDISSAKFKTHRCNFHTTTRREHWSPGTMGSGNSTAVFRGRNGGTPGPGHGLASRVPQCLRREEAVLPVSWAPGRLRSTFEKWENQVRNGEV